MKSDIISKLRAGRECRGLAGLDGPLAYMRGTHSISYGEIVEIMGSDGKRRS